jgi:hypothetical protein
MLHVTWRPCDQVELRMFAEAKKCVFPIFERICHLLQSNSGTVEFGAFLEISNVQRNVVKLDRLSQARLREDWLRHRKAIRKDHEE